MYPSGRGLRALRRAIQIGSFRHGSLNNYGWSGAIHPEIALSQFSSSPYSSTGSHYSTNRNRHYILTACLSRDAVLNDSCRIGLALQFDQTRLLRTSSLYYTKESEATPTSITTSKNDDKKPSSKVEESVKAIKTDLQDKEKGPPPKRSLWKRIEDEILHYYHGFRLLVLETRISIGLINRVLNGKSLSRREHRQLVRTTSDLFRLVPFSVFIIVPFMEFLLPVFLKFFPGMLPSTFQTKNDRENKMKAELKVKLEMAKFLQQTLDDMSLESKGHSSEKAKEFAAFFHKVRTSGDEVSNEEIIKYSKLFEDEITLDSLSRPQLVALCHVLEIPAIGNNTMLRFQLKMRLRSLVSDDRIIEREGIDSLSVSELQLACKARGMRAVGVAEDRLRRQLSQWLQLSLHEKVPPSLLLLSRALYLPEDLPQSAKLQATISALPESAGTHAKAAIGEREGKVDHKTRIEVIQEEDRRIKEERQESLKEEKPAPPVDKEVLVDTAPTLTADGTSGVSPSREAEKVKPKEEVEKEKLADEHAEPEADVSELLLIRKRDPKTVSETVARRLCRNVPHPVADLLKEGLTKDDLDNIEGALDTLGSEKKRLYIEKEELKELKAEMADYDEDIHDLYVLTKTGDTPVEVRETKAAKRLYKRVNRMISNMDSVVHQLHKEEDKLISELKATVDAPEEKKSQLVATEELIDAIQRLQKVPDPARMARIIDVIKNLDLDSDGHVKVDDVLKVIELIGRENVKLHPKQISEIVHMLSKEESIEGKPQNEQPNPGPKST